MDALHDWSYMLAAIAGLTLGTVATRSSFFVLPARIQLPQRVERALRYAPACALAAIIAPGVLSQDKHITIGWGNNQMWALVAAALVFAKTRNMLAMMVAGMGVFTTLRLLV